MLRRIVGVAKNDLMHVEHGYVAAQETAQDARILRSLGMEARAEEPEFDSLVLEDEHLFEVVFAGHGYFVLRTLLKEAEAKYLLDDEFTLEVADVLGMLAEDGATVPATSKKCGKGKLILRDLGAATLLKTTI